MSNLAEVRNVYTGYFANYKMASETAERDGLSMSKDYGNLPYAYNISLVGSRVDNMFDVVSHGNWEVRIYVFESEQEKDIFMSKNAHLFNSPSQN